ncbi:hypothetical protein XbC2_39 [Xanthomonas phage XbC2]|nr:hypothetical protein XbC2_39 [Xanthomonas phage XbC2]
MVQTTFKNLYVQDAFKDVLKMLMTPFETKVLNDISFKNENVRCRLVRARDDRMTFNAYAIGEDTDYEIIHCTCFYDTGTVVSNLRSSHFRLNSNCENIGFSTYRKGSTELLISHAINIQNIEHCTLQYPLHEEQVFQELTRFPVPLESDIDLFMNIGSYVMEGITKFKAYSFNAGWIAEDQIDETNKESMVQSVREVLDGLIQVEKDRIAKGDDFQGDK